MDKDKKSVAEFVPVEHVFDDDNPEWTRDDFRRGCVAKTCRILSRRHSRCVTCGCGKPLDRRRVLIEKRRKLMDEWADYLAGAHSRDKASVDLDVGAVMAALSEGRPLPAEKTEALAAMLKANSMAADGLPAIVNSRPRGR